MTDPDGPLPDERFEPVARALDRVGKLRREVLAEAAQLEDVPGQERFRAAALAGMPQAGRDAGETPAWRGRRWLAAAGILLVSCSALWWFRSFGGGEGASENHMLGSSVQPLEPVGAVASFARFRWLPGPFTGGYFEVLVHDEESGALVRRSGSRDEAEWLLSAAEEAQLPERIRWEVQPFDASGRPGRPVSAQASRSR
jgi:hypothetical protein